MVYASFVAIVVLAAALVPIPGARLVPIAFRSQVDEVLLLVKLLHGWSQERSGG